jgi:mannosyltransferase
MALPRNLTPPSLRRLLVAPGLLLFVIALVPRLYRLGAQSLWLDEGGTWSEVTGRTGKGWLALLGELFSKDAAYPLYHILLKAWVTLAGDSEWALRFPSALAGAATVTVLYYAALELGRWTMDDGRWTTGDERAHYHPVTPSPRRPVIAALLFTVAPFALWYAQDAKVYSLLMLAVALEIWALLRALDRPGPRSWLLLAGVSLASLFVHRLALLPVAGLALAYAIIWPTTDDRRHTQAAGWSVVSGRSSVWRIGVALLALALAAGGVAGTILAVRDESRSVGGHIAAGPLQALWLTFTRFSLDRWPGDIAGYLGLPLAIWLLPCAALTLWGLGLLIRDALARRPGAIAILCMAGVPLLLLLLALALMAMPIYEARYATVAFPAWLLLLAYPFRELRTENREPGRLRFGSRFLVLGSLLLANALLLFQPNKGLFSGDPLKEQWRAAVTYLARQAHPDDLIIVHPYYVSPLWDYYAPRVTPDRLPQPVIFPVFAAGDCVKSNPDPAQALECIRRKYNEPFFNAQAYGKKRALLLIAPDHAKTVDPPKTLAQLLTEYSLTQHKPSDQPPTQDDKYGWVGLRFQYSSDQRTWPCGGNAYIGVEVMCQSYPSTFNAGGRGKVPQPATPLDATYGGELHLRGYSLDLFGGVARPGGTRPVTLYWDAAAPPTHDYQMFLHLCRDCALPPLASDDDSPPLHGYAPAGLTTTWQVGEPVHDERTVALPAELPPGRYTLLLGVYPVGNPSELARLRVASDHAQILGGTRLVLGEIEIGQP